MPRLTLLGSAATIANRGHDSIYLLLQYSGGELLIDCGGSPSYKLAQLGTDPGQLDGVLLTHDHSDHIYGFPLLVQTLMLLNWAGQWSKELVVWGLPETLGTARELLRLFELTDRIPIDWRPLSAAGSELVLETQDLRILCAPVQHSRPTVGLRIEGKSSGLSLVYSSDTEPCPSLRTLAQSADILLHEATVMAPMPGHSTPTQAGEIAAAAQVRRLVLVHFDPAQNQEIMLAEAAIAFGGPVEMGQDWMTFEF